jgi:hypothetical protein
MGSTIRLLRRAEGSADFASETIGNADLPRTCPRPVFSPSGSFLATSFRSRKDGRASTAALYELVTSAKTQSVVMPGFIPTHIAVTSDSKQLVVVGRRGGGFDFFRQTIEAFKETSIKKRSDQATVGKG